MISVRQRLLGMCILILCWAPVHAYIDPGTGSALIQGLVAAVAAIGVTLKLYWHRIIGFLGLKKNSEDSLPSSSESEEQP